MARAVKVRVIEPAALAGEIEAIDGVMQRAYRTGPFSPQIGWYAGAHPGRIVVAEDQDGPIGTGCCIAYPDAGFGWVGLVATDPAAERRGIGRVVTERTIELLAGFGCVAALDASLVGGPLYERMGFTDHGLTTVMNAPDDLASFAVPGDETSVAGRADLDDITALDAEAFGADRGALLRQMFLQYPGRTVVARGADGRPIGFAIGQDHALGPVVANGPAALAEVVRAAAGLAFRVPPRVCVPPGSEHLDGFASLGFTVARELRHMRDRLPVLPTATATYAARISLGIG